MAWILEGHTGADIQETIAADLAADPPDDGNPPEPADILEAAYIRLLATVPEAGDNRRLAVEIERRRLILARAYALGDYKTALSASQDASKLLGLYSKTERRPPRPRKTPKRHRQEPGAGETP